MNESEKYSITPFFLPFEKQQIFCIYLQPANKKPLATIMYLHPFAEEMHKSRRMAALQARRFAGEGCAVLLIDLLGCGDSSLDFEDARWEVWKNCAQSAINWIERNSATPIFLWGLRLGAMLATEVAGQMPHVSGLILWQPVINGESHLNQFLRIKIASDMLTSTENALKTKQLRELLALGRSVEIGGYMLSSQLASSIDKLRLINFTLKCPVCWLEIPTSGNNALSPSSTTVINQWIQSGQSVYTSLVTGECFWNSQEITECDELLNKTMLKINKLLSCAI